MTFSTYKQKFASKKQLFRGMYSA